MVAQTLQRAVFTVALSVASSTPVAVDYLTYDNTATAYGDYVKAMGTIVWNPGDPLVKTVETNILADTTQLAEKDFSLKLSNYRNVTAGTTTTQEVTISGVPAYDAVPFPGYRAAILGDSTSYMCHHWNPASLVTGNNPTGNKRYAFYSTGATGYWYWFQALNGNQFELEPALQPNTNPGVNSTAPNNGYNFAIYSSQVAQWNDADFDPLASIDTGSALAHNVGPMVNALNYITKFDCAWILGGTNDLSSSADASLGPATLNGLIADVYNLAKLGKWVFIMTIMPRTNDLLQSVNGVGGYTTAQIVQIQQNILYVNAGLRTAFGNGAAKNVFLVDVWNYLVGPTASVIPGTPTDPHGLISPATGYGLGTNIPSTPGNYRTDLPQFQANFDGLHENSVGGYAMALAMVAACTQAQVPTAPTGKLGPLTIGPNLHPNPTWNVSTTPRVLGAPLVLGRSTCLGTPIGWASPGFPAGYTGNYIDQNANQGQGYAHGPVPDYTFIYRLFNGLNSSGAQVAYDGPEVSPSAPAGTQQQEESYSNFVQYTFSSFTAIGPGNSTPVPAYYTVDSTFAAGALTTSIVTVNGQRGLKLSVNFPSGLTHNEGFVVRVITPAGQHGPWDNYGFETGATASVPAAVYTAGEILAADCEMQFSNMTGHLQDFRLVLDFLSINQIAVNNGDNSTSGACISGIAGVESFFPFSKIAQQAIPNVDMTIYPRTIAVPAPTPASGETQQYSYLEWQFSWDCSTQGATADIIILNPRIATLSGATL